MAENEKKLRLDLDSFMEEGYDGIYTEYDIGGEGHYITIESKDKKKFLDAFGKAFSDRAKDMLEEVKEED